MYCIRMEMQSVGQDRCAVELTRKRQSALAWFLIKIVLAAGRAVQLDRHIALASGLTVCKHKYT